MDCARQHIYELYLWDEICHPSTENLDLYPAKKCGAGIQSIVLSSNGLRHIFSSFENIAAIVINCKKIPSKSP